jgi:hypothetical protein
LRRRLSAWSSLVRPRSQERVPDVRSGFQALL